VDGERWAVTATPTAGGVTGAPGSDAVTIQNTPPGAPIVAITPASPSSGDALVCSLVAASFDLDGDAISYTLSWDVDGASYGGATTSTLPGDTVPGGVTADGSTWTCTAAPDNSVTSGPSASASVTVRDVLRGCPDSRSATRVRQGPQPAGEVPRQHTNVAVLGITQPRYR
jgi:hypothetical protein